MQLQIGGTEYRDCYEIYSSLDQGTKDDAKADILSVLEKAPREVSGLLLAIESGQISGQVYMSTCCCLVGSLAKLKEPSILKQYREIKTSNEKTKFYDRLEELVRKRDPSSPAELWFGQVLKGDTPKDNPFSADAQGWIVEWLSSKGMLK